MRSKSTVTPTISCYTFASENETERGWEPWVGDHAILPWFYSQRV